jgi:predicted nucleic acid-binding protein
MARLIDSSLWVDFMRRKSPLALKAQIQPWILDPAAVLCEPVAFEILRHATAAERPMIEAQFATLPILAQPPRLWREATLLGQKCRDMGCNAGSLDLVIACIAIHHNAELITFDADYLRIALASELRVNRLSRP